MRSVFIILGLCSFLQPSFSQTAVQYKEINYLSDSGFTLPIKIKAGSRIGIKIINVNKKLVDIGQDVTQTSFNETQPALFDMFSKTSISPPSSSGGANQLASGSTDLLDLAIVNQSTLPDTLKRKIRNLNQLYSHYAQSFLIMKGALTTYLEIYDREKRLLAFQSDILILQNTCDKTFDELLNELAELTKSTFQNLVMNVPQVDRSLLDAKNYVTNRAVLNRYISDLLENEQNTYDELSRELLPSRLDELSSAISKISETVTVITNQIKRLSNFSSNASYELILTQLNENELNDEFVDLKRVYSINDFQKYHVNTDAFRSIGRRDFFAAYNYFTKSNWTYYVEPKTINSDLTVFTVNITPKNEVSCSPLARSYEMRIKAKSGLKIDFSTGLFANFGGNNFIDQSYKYDSVPGSSDQYKIVRNKPKNSIFPSVGALMHVYPRTGSDISWSGTFGVSTKDLEKVNYHFGGSLIFGMERRFIITLGTTLTKAILVDDKYVEGQIINKADAPTSIPTATFNRLGYFVALTYNLSSK
jgi:hypothetical protein